MNRNILIFSTCILFPLGAIQAQKQPSSGLGSESFEITSIFKAKLDESPKVTPTPPVQEGQESPIGPLEYNIPDQDVDVHEAAPELKPLAMPTPRKEPDYGFYAKAGFGTPMSPLLELSYHNKFSKTDHFGITYRHHSALKESLNPYQRFSNHHALLEYTHFLDQAIAVGGHLGFDFNGLRYYGYGNDVVSEPDLIQRFKKFNAGVHITNKEKNDAGFDYDGKLNYYWLNDSHGTTEQKVNFDLMLKKDISEDVSISLDGGLDYISFNDTTSRTQNFFIPRARPFLTWNNEDLRIKVGVLLSSDGSSFFVSPDVEGSYNITRALSVYAGWTGRVNQNTYDNLRQHCPWINASFNMIHTTEMEGYAGIRGEAARVVFDAKAGYHIANNLPLFLNDPTQAFRKFQVVYDSAKIISASGSLRYNIMDELGVRFATTYNYFVLPTYKVSYGIPNLDMNVALVGNYDKKLYGKIELFALGGIDYQNESLESKTLDPVFDLNLGLEYKPTEHFGVFLDLNNLLNNTSARFYRYTSYGFNLMAGVTVKF